MSAKTEVRSTVLAYLDALISRDDFARFYAEDVTFEAAGTGWSVAGADVVERAIRDHYEVEFDSHPEVINVVADDRRAAVELIFAGRNVGEFDGAPPTGNMVRIPISLYFDFRDGRIAAIRVYYSWDQLLEQVRGDGAG